MHFQNTLFRRFGLIYLLSKPRFSKKCNSVVRTIGSSESSRWKKTVKRFSRVVAHVSNVEFHAETNDPNVLHCADKLQVFASNGVSISDCVFVEEAENAHLTIRCNPSTMGLLKVSIPVHTDISVKSEGNGPIKIKNIENTMVNVEANCGDVTVENIKSNSVSVLTKAGNITIIKAIQGDVDLKTKCGKIKTERMQGSSISIATDSSGIDAGDLYGQDIFLRSNDGDISVKSLHGESEVESQNGNLKVCSAEGRLNVMNDEKDIQVYLTSKITYADISTNRGNITLMLATDLGGQLEIESQHVDDSQVQPILQEISKQIHGPCQRYLAQVNDGGPRIRSKAPSGNVTLKAMSWVEAMRTQ